MELRNEDENCNLFRYCSAGRFVQQQTRIEPSLHGDEPLLAVTLKVKQYSSKTVLPRLNEKRDQDVLKQLLLVSKILIDPQDGVSINKMAPGKFMVYNMLSNAGLGAVSTIGLSPVKKQTLRSWSKKYMQANPADVILRPFC